MIRRSGARDAIAVLWPSDTESCAVGEPFCNRALQIGLVWLVPPPLLIFCKLSI